MDSDIKHDPKKELDEIRNQLSYSKRLGLFFGAGTSKSIGMSDINSLTANVEASLKGIDKDNFGKVKSCLPDDVCKNKNIEEILNQLRLIRQITFEKPSSSFGEISGEVAKKLDIKICNKIYDILSSEEEKADLSIPKKFVAWLNWLSRDFAKEIFTTNYDLIFEKALESLLVPYFDGFVGSHEPFFLAESLEKNTSSDTPPSSWIRLWKLHGSLGWFWKPYDGGKLNRIVRLGSNAKTTSDYEEIVIYPSREKYESSRKQPFISYFDRLKSFLNDGERLFLINGYSFSDDHINSQIFDSLRQNNRLHIMAFFHSDQTINRLIESERNYPNLSAYGAKKAIINGIVGEWNKNGLDDFSKQFWDEKKDKLTLGDFKELVNFLLICSGKKEKLEKGAS